MTGINKLWSFISKHLPNFIFELIEILYNIPIFFRLGKALKTKKYDLIYERYAFFMVAGALQAKRHNIPFVLEANEVSGIEDRARPQVFLKLCAYFERILIKRTTSVFPVSSKLKEMLIDNKCSAQKIVIQPNAIDPKNIQIDQKLSTHLKAQYNPEGDVIIGCAGWFDKWDRLDFLIESFSDLLQQHSNIKLMLIGDGPVLRELQTKTIFKNNKSKIILTGVVTRKEIYTYLSQLDIAVLPHSNNFGSPVILFELMGLGRAIVAPAVPPIQDVIVNEDAALTFTPLDRQEFTQKIEKLIINNDLRRELGQRAKDKTYSEYTWKENAQKIIDSAS